MITTPKITRERIKEYLNNGKRFDSRKLDEFREFSVELGVSKNAEGSAKVKIGETEVIAGIKMDMTEPYPDSPNKGNLMVTAELLALSSPRFENGPPKFDAIEIGRVIDRGIRESNVIDLEKLCIKEGEKVWNIFIDIYSINDDGNLLDAAGIAAIIALKNSKIPKYDKENEKVIHGEWTEENIPMKKDVPLPITFHKIGNAIIIDPTLEEEDISETRITIGSSKGTINSIQKSREAVLTEKEMIEILDKVEKRSEELNKKLEKYLK
ncbi:MAG: exosome complex protein Rrp42 [Nanoarchaeota archaeon]